MHTINDIMIFLNFYKGNKSKINKNHFLEAVSCVKNYSEFKMILELFKDAGLQEGIRFYDSIVEFICSYKDCRRILDYLLENAAIVNRGYFIQLILLSSSKKDARKIYDEFISQNTRTIITEEYVEKFGNKKLIAERFRRKVSHEYETRGFRFIEHVNNIKKDIGLLSANELKIRAMNSTSKNKKISFSKTEFVRNEYVKKFALKVSGGRCQLCEKPAPFNNKIGEPFLEVHHVKYLSQGGTDTIDNVVALCPNCHRKIHQLELEADLKKIKEKALVNKSI